jgi:hypothetical protein
MTKDEAYTYIAIAAVAGYLFAQYQYKLQAVAKATAEQVQQDPLAWLTGMQNYGY